MRVDEKRGPEEHRDHLKDSATDVPEHRVTSLSMR